MNDSDAFEYYNLLKNTNLRCKPYSKKAVEFHVRYPLSYTSAYNALQKYGEERLQELLDMVFMGYLRKEEDYEDIRKFTRNYY